MDIWMQVNTESFGTAEMVQDHLSIVVFTFIG
jgi:hypothetical protein